MDDGGVLERVLVMTGIGGQGIQLGAQVVARAALAEGREVQLFGSYGGMMRGGNTEAVLIVADGPVASPPTVSRAWSAIVLHDAFWSDVRERLTEDSILVANTSVVSAEDSVGPWWTASVPAGSLASSVGNSSGVAMAALGAYVAVTGLVSVDALTAELPRLLPARRSRHLVTSQELLWLGYDHVGASEPGPSELCSAWRTS
jgi:Pyruvate/2-oxoacid:ferredoxin oxidoreductase gamma subunit